MGLFRRAETPQETSERHETILHLIEQVTELRGRLRAVEAEWDDMRAQIRKGYQRMEKARERLDASRAEQSPEEEPGESPVPSFARKWAQLKGVG